jgi:hypothetical protein
MPGAEGRRFAFFQTGSRPRGQPVTNDIGALFRDHAMKRAPRTTEGTAFSIRHVRVDHTRSRQPEQRYFLLSGRGAAYCRYEPPAVLPQQGADDRDIAGPGPDQGIPPCQAASHLPLGVRQPMRGAVRPQPAGLGQRPRVPPISSDCGPRTSGRSSGRRRSPRGPALPDSRPPPRSPSRPRESRGSPRDAADRPGRDQGLPRAIGRGLPERRRAGGLSGGAGAALVHHRDGG